MRTMHNFIGLAALISLIWCLCGCSTKPTEQVPEGAYVLYYTSAERFSLTTEHHEIKGSSIQEIGFNMLSQMQNPVTVGNYSLFAVEDLVNRVAQEGENLINVYMTENYKQLSVSDEVLLRAGIVKALIQLDGIEYVSFYVNELPLTDPAGNPVGIMSANSFLDSKGENLSNYQQVTVSVYFADETGNTLVETERESTISSSFSVERQVINALLEGPEETGLLATMPGGTSLISVTVKDKICYVNFDKNFLTGDLVANPYVSIYSLVNSLTGLSNISKVQIMVDGDSTVKFREIIPLNAPFERNLDYNQTGGRTK